MSKLFLLFTLLVSFQSFAQVINDETYLDESFMKFKNELLACVIQQDAVKLKEFLAERVLDSNDGCGFPGCTKEELVNNYFSENSSPYWNQLLTIIRFGFTRIEDEYPDIPIPHDPLIFKAPSYLSKIDTENELIVLGENVNIRNQPGLHSEIIKTASYQIFKCDCNILTMTDNTYQTVDGVDWVEVKLNNNSVGYVAAELTSYDIYKELTIAKVNGKWKIISFYKAPGC